MKRIAQQLQSFRFADLFNQLGWDGLRIGLEKEIGGELYVLHPVAQKRGIQILHCLPGGDGAIPPYAIRQKIERKVTAEAREHLIIFTDAAQSRQIWQWVSRASGRPTQYREVKWQAKQSTELLEQKLKAITFDLGEEESLTVFGVAERLRGGFDRDNVTKKFYKVFQIQRDAFQQFIEGIPSDDHQRWYTAVVIDRLMFLWFLQEKSFLDGDKRYLRNRLEAHLAANPGSSFYKSFLSPLFFRGFAEERNEANRAAIESEFGKVPYLNGGLFAEHELEREYGAAIDIPDTAFSSLFAFFDEWDWHLDERPLASGKEINPDVLGYIFEKFVNQKQMGAYYTKEDITEYIGKNTLIPALFEKVRAACPAAFDAHAWPLLQEDPRRYLYPAMLHGLPPSPASGRGAGGEGLYPPEIANGLDTQAPDLLERRKPWNKTAPPSHGLPTEIWRETIARHQRAREILAKLEAGEITSVADLITYNLNIRQFAQDVIERCADPALLRAFWVMLAGRLPRKSNEKFRHGISVLDPTCGSGAFLFAALQILKPLYQACLTAMSGVLADEAIAGRALGEKWQDIEEIVARFNAAALDRERDYAITKHIIVHNLYGVDIETQATEIAKLRLFLKLVALLEPGDAIEPLPDIDFNIRAGNTLVGYASADETERAVKGATQGSFDFDDSWTGIKTKLVAAGEEFKLFHHRQMERGGHVTPEDKQALDKQLRELEETLNTHLCREYGKDPSNSKQYAAWKTSHRPFHWYVDFYPIMAAGGFDAVIGNPPYVEYQKVRSTYTVRGYHSEPSGNLYCFCIERLKTLCHDSAMSGLIVPIAVGSVSETISAREVADGMYSLLWSSHYAIRPAKLFEGVEQRLSILIGKHGGQKNYWFTTKYHQWFVAERSELFHQIRYQEMPGRRAAYSSWPKLGREIESKIHAKLNTFDKYPAQRLIRETSPWSLIFHRTPGYWIRMLDFLPFFQSPAGDRSVHHIRELYADNQPARAQIGATGSSSLYFWWFFAEGNCRNLTKGDVLGFPMPPLDEAEKVEVLRLFDELMGSYKLHSQIKKRADSQYQEFNWVLAKPTVDAIDQFLARVYGLSNEELDFLINYDIKVRAGSAEAADD